MEAIRLQGITFAYPGQEKPVLDGVSAVVEQGAFVVVCGTSGSGKTTLLRQIKREIAPHGNRPVSYTHLDVYKRQLPPSANSCLMSQRTTS